MFVFVLLLDGMESRFQRSVTKIEKKPTIQTTPWLDSGWCTNPDAKRRKRMCVSR